MGFNAQPKASSYIVFFIFYLARETLSQGMYIAISFIKLIKKTLIVMYSNQLQYYNISPFFCCVHGFAVLMILLKV